MRIAEGRLIALVSYDVGFEIDLERVGRLWPEGERASAGGSRKVSPRVEYTLPPLALPLGERRLVLRGEERTATVAVRLHEFGALTVLFTLPLTGAAWEDLPELTAWLAAATPFTADAHRVLDETLARVGEAVTRPTPAAHQLMEDYYAIQITRLEPALSAAALVEDEREVLARTLHCETLPLSRSEIDEVLATAVTYTPQDLVVTDWQVAVVYDDEYEDVLNVLELLNVQLLELRFLDRMLDGRVNALYGEVARLPRLYARGEVAVVRELALLRLDTAALRERMVNALKLVGDLYLTKIHARTAARFHLEQWQRSVDGKLDLVQRVSDVFGTRAATARAELLELTIIILIAVDIVLYFFG